MVKMIIATSSKEDGYAIGKDNKLLWKVPEDLDYFKEQTEGGCVVMGSNTFNSLPFKNGLPNRKNLVLSKTPRKSFMCQDVVWFTDYTHIFQLQDSVVLPFKDMWVIGGATVYEQMLPLVSEIHHTTVSGDYSDADTHFDMSFLGDGEWEKTGSSVLCGEATVCVWKRVSYETI